MSHVFTRVHTGTFLSLRHWYTGKAIYILHMRVRTGTAVCDFTDGGGIRHAVCMRYTDMRTAGEY